MRVAAIIPVLNEAGAIGPTIARIPRAHVHDIIVVDGGSTDATIAQAQAAGAFVLQESRRGYGQACAAGAQLAGSRGADIVMFMDGDGADAGDRAADLLAPILANTADFTLARRASAGRAPGSMGPHQVLAGEAIGLAVWALTGTRYRDMCAFRALTLANLNRLNMAEMTYGWNLEMQIKAARQGLRVLEIDLPYHCRIAGNSKVAGNWLGTWRAGKRIISTLLRVGLAK